MLAARHLTIASRVAASLLGGYAFTWGFASLGIASQVAFGVEFHAAETVMMLLSFLLFLGLFLWAFAARSLARVWTVLAGGGALMSAAALLLQHSLT